MKYIWYLYRTICGTKPVKAPRCCLHIDVVVFFTLNHCFYTIRLIHTKRHQISVHPQSVLIHPIDFFYLFLFSGVFFPFLSPVHVHFGSCSGYVSISRALAPLFIYLFIYFVLVSFVVSLFYKVFWFNEKNTKGGGGKTGGVEGKPSKGMGAGGATGGIEGRPRWTKAGRRWQTG